MSFNFTLVKSFTITAHLLCLLAGLAAVAVHIFGFENARVNTMEHTFYIVGIIIASFAALITIFGLHGAFCELLSVSCVYALFLLLLFMMQVQQMRSFQSDIFKAEAQVYLEHCWQGVSVSPDFMQNLEKNYHCCGLNGPQDYQQLNTSLPSHCQTINNYVPRGCSEGLQLHYAQAMQRELLSNWSLMTVQLFSYALTLLFCILLYKRPQRIHAYIEPARLPEAPQLNHVDSRAHLLSS